MKIGAFFTAILAGLIFWGSAWAQNKNLDIALTPIANTKTDWEFRLSGKLNFNPEDGIVIQIPGEMMIVPISVSVNGKKMWMQNLLTVPEKDSVIAWQIVPEGLMLLFKRGLIRQGDQLNLLCIANLLKKDLTNKTVYLKKIVSKPDGLKVSTQPLASGTIPSIPNR